MEDHLKNSIAFPAVPDVRTQLAAKLPGIAVLVFGIVVLFAIGFSDVSAAHNATHDTRHATGFPCH